jgi:hypothetical protein
MKSDMHRTRIGYCDDPRDHPLESVESGGVTEHPAHGGCPGVQATNQEVLASFWQLTVATPSK